VPAVGGRAVFSGVAVKSDARRRLYSKAVKHAKVREHAQGAAETVSIYRVNLPLRSIHFTTHESNTDNLIRGGHEGHETDRHNSEVLGSQS